jgi:hypothetical protein
MSEMRNALSPFNPLYPSRDKWIERKPVCLAKDIKETKDGGNREKRETRRVSEPPTPFRTHNPKTHNSKPKTQNRAASPRCLRSGASS